LTDSLKDELLNNYTNNPTIELNVGDTVAVVYGKSKKLIRCTIDAIKVFYNIKYYLLFAMDFGTLFYTTQRTDIYKTRSKNLVTIPTPIRMMSLNILPASLKTDFRTNALLLTLDYKWCDIAITNFINCTREAKFIKYNASAKFLSENGEVEVGDLIITSASNTYSLSEVLLNSKLALSFSSPDDFYKHYLKSFTCTLERWQDNNRLGGVLKGTEGSMMFNYESQITKMREELDESRAIINIATEKVKNWLQKNEMFFGNNKKRNKEAPKNEMGAEILQSSVNLRVKINQLEEQCVSGTCHNEQDNRILIAATNRMNRNFFARKQSFADFVDDSISVQLNDANRWNP
jgi:hypothetical protein